VAPFGAQRQASQQHRPASAAGVAAQVWTSLGPWQRVARPELWGSPMGSGFQQPTVAATI